MDRILLAVCAAFKYFKAFGVDLTTESENPKNIRFVFSKNSGMSLLELTISMALLSAITLGATGFFWRALEVDRGLREAASFADAMGLIKATLQNPSCGSQTFTVNTSGVGEHALTFPDPLPDVISLQVIRSGATGQVDIATSSSSGMIRSMSLRPLGSNFVKIDSDFGLKRYNMVLSVIGPEVTINGLKKTLSQELFVRFESDPAQNDEVAFCGNLKVPPVPATPSSNASASVLTSEVKTNNSSCASTKLILPGGVECGSDGFLSSTYTEDNQQTNSKEMKYQCTGSLPASYSVNCWGMEQK